MDIPKNEWILITVDPSINKPGYAAFLMEGKDVKDLICLKHIKVRSTKMLSQFDWHYKAIGMAQHIRNITEDVIGNSDLPFMLLTETQENWHSGKGIASKDKGDIQKLYMMTGALCQAMQTHPRCIGVWGVGPNTWKGHTPKDRMIARAQRFCAKHGWHIDGDLADDPAEALLLGKFAVPAIVYYENLGLMLDAPCILISHRQRFRFDADHQWWLHNNKTFMEVRELNVIERLGHV